MVNPKEGRSALDTNDVHKHRRSGDTDDMTGHRLERAADSSLAKIVTRLVTPMLLSALLFVSGYLGSRLVNQSDKQGDDIASMKSDIRDLNTRMTEGVIRQVASQSQRVDDHESRIQKLERTMPTP